MRIGIDGRFFGPFGKGLGRYTQRLIEHLEQIDHENEYVIFLRRENFSQYQPQNSRFKKVLADIRWYTASEQLLLPLIILRQHVDLMHYVHFNVSLFAPRPFVLTIHDLILTHYSTERATTLSPMLFRFKRMAYEIALRRSLYRATKILTVSNYSRSQILSRYDLDPHRMQVTYEACEPVSEIQRRSNPEDRAFLARQYHLQHPYVLFVGNAYPYKNIETLLKTWKELKQRGDTGIHLVLVGKMDHFYLRLKDQVWKDKTDDVIHFTGFVPDEHLSILYRGSLAYIFASLEEGFGLPGLEAMSYGIPVLSSNIECLTEVLGPAPLYFDPLDISGIIKALHQVADHPELREKMRAAGLEQVKKFSWKTLAEQTLQSYRHAIQDISSKRHR